MTAGFNTVDSAATEPAHERAAHEQRFNPQVKPM
jgi:hypothetical protein